MGRVVGVVLLVAAAPCVWGQGTKADYARAWAARKARGPRLVSPVWLDAHRCWFRVGGAVTLVDGRTGKRRPAYDPAALAAAVKAATGKGFDASTVRGIAADGEGIAVWVGTRAWRVSGPAGKTLTERSPVEVAGWRLAPVARTRSRRRLGTPSGILFVNATSATVELRWLLPGGGSRKYATLGAGDRHWQHTFAGHAWEVKGAKGVVGYYVGADEPRVARIGDPAPKAATRRPPGGPRVWVRGNNVYLERGGTRRQLTRDGRPGDAYGGRVHWSPDRKYVVVMKTKAGQGRTISFVESAPRGGGQPKLHTMRYAKPGDRVAVSRPVLFEVASGKVTAIDTALFPTPYALTHLRWAADSSRFTFRYNQRGHQLLRVVAVDAKTGRARTLVEETSETFVDYPKTHAHWLSDGRLIWSSERDGWRHLYLFDRAGTLVRQLTRGRRVVREIARVDESAGAVEFWASGVVAGQDPYHRHYCRVSLGGGETTVLTEGDGTHEVRFSPGRRYLVDRWSRVDLPPVAVLRRADTGALVCELDRAPARKGVGVLRFVAKGRDGKTDIHGIIHRPSTFEASKRYPVVEQIYAGPHGAHVPKAYRAYHGAQRVAELGFVVVQIDGMGTSYRGKRFHDVCWRNLGDAGFPDRIAWLRAAAKAHAWMDLSRGVGIYGGSAGGQNAMRALIAHPDVYTVAVADCGCHDNRDDKIWWNELWMGHPVGPHYAKSSNVAQAHRLKGKLLLIVGEVDRNVDPASTMRVVNALIKADKDFDLLVMPGVGHGAAGTRYGQRRQMDFLVRHLLGVEPRAR